jgi:hypothetical protein
LDFTTATSTSRPTANLEEERTWDIAIALFHPSQQFHAVSVYETAHPGNEFGLGNLDIVAYTQNF